MISNGEPLHARGQADEMLLCFGLNVIASFVDIPTVISLIENPFKITGKTSNSRTFTQNTFFNATLYVPKGTIDKYKATDG